MFSITGTACSTVTINGTGYFYSYSPTEYLIRYTPRYRPNDPKHAEGPLDDIIERRNAQKVFAPNVSESNLMRFPYKTTNMPRYPPRD